MKRTVIVLAACVGAFGATLQTAAAQSLEPAPVVTSPRGGASRGIGVGFASMLRGPSGLSVAYDAGAWHLDAIFAARDFGDSQFELGARGWFHLHSTGSADFSLGGGLGLRPEGGDDNLFEIEAGFLIRAFVVPNVALSGFGGLGLVPTDDDDDGNRNSDGFEVDGQLVGVLSLHYFFQ
jgi:hypothetical protein